jgi:ubiquinone/menaquinone biosynthesis C-methylase UbiE
MVLSRAQARSFYDGFGEKQDSQSFYEDAALEDLVAHGDFEQADSVFELGCGTGRFAYSLIKDHLSSSASYVGTELSGVMAKIAQQRLSAYTDRAKVEKTEGAIVFPVPDQFVDRVVSTYVLDLLSESDIHLAVAEASRVLKPGGRFCLVSLTDGTTFISGIVSRLWNLVFRLRPSLVGGCRPIHLASLFDDDAWSISYRNVITGFGVPSEVLIACLKTPRQNAGAAR